MIDLNDTVTLKRFLIRIMSKEPVLIQDKEEIYHTSIHGALARCYTMVRRTSYMVRGPNRWVNWDVAVWDANRQRWESVISGKSHLPESAGPQ